jgi:hypothetical protein
VSPRRRSTGWPLALLVLAMLPFAFSGCSSDKPKTTVSKVSWSRLVSLVRDCKAKRVDQTHSRLITVMRRRDGRKAWGFEPRIDAIIPILNRANIRCGPIVFSTE